ncbi:MAG TPA: hypothetical protein VFK06_17840 [Candidatus Angelobacter sp.]|nr:hypothetical protein [Candidatus Angelobacter sp.]
MHNKGCEWINVDLNGLRKLLARRSKEFIVYELVQNAWDEKCSFVSITLSRPQRGTTSLVVADDSPEGFQNLAHAFTLFAGSYKKNSAVKRGAFNAGDKFVLAFCEEASVISTTGGLLFDRTGRHFIRKRTTKGSEFTGVLKVSLDEWEKMSAAVLRLIPPVRTTFNGEEVPVRMPLHTFECCLPTVVADDSGSLSRRMRTTDVRVYTPLDGETASLYEMGIPVVETGDKWHVDIQQKVPLNMERDNVPPSFLQTVRVSVLNEMAQHLNKEDATSAWVRGAAGDERMNRDPFNRIIGMRFGDRRVTWDPSDNEANLIATSKGYTVIASSSLSSDEWKNVRRFESSVPAGQVTPSPKPFSPAGIPLQLLAESEKDAAIGQFEEFSRKLGLYLLKRPINVTFANDSGWKFRGCYGNECLTVNVCALGRGWFRGTTADLLERWIPFLIHELAHDKVRGHLCDDYHVECCRLAGLLARRMHEAPILFALSDTTSQSA